MRRYVATTAALSALLFACGKDEPAPTPQPAAQIDAAPAPSGGEGHKDLAKPEDKAQENKPAEPDKLTAAPPAGDAQPALVAGAAPPERAALTPSSLATFPAEVVAVGGTPSLSALVKAFAGQASRVEGMELPPDPIAMALSQLKQETGIDLGWLDTDKPLRFAVPDPKKYPDAFALLVPEKAGAAFDPKTLPEAKDAAGHLAMIDAGPRKLYFDRPVEGHVLVTTEDGLAKQLEGFVKELAAWTPKDPLVLDTSVENLVRIYGSELKEAKDMVTQMGGSMAQNPEMAAQMGPLLEVAGTGFALVEGTSRMSLALDPNGDFPRIGLAFKPLPGSALDKIVKDLSGRKLSLASSVPADAWAVFGYDVPGIGYLNDAKAVVDAITQATASGPMALTWSDDEKKTLLALLTKTQELQGSQGLTWIRQDGARPFVFESVSDSKDGAALNQAIGEVGDFIYKKLWGEGRKAMLAQGAPANELPENMSFKDFVGLVGKQTAQMGIGVAVNETKSAAGTSIGELAVKIDWSRLPLEGEGKVIADLVGDHVGISLAGEGQHFAAAFGPDAAARAVRILDGVKSAAEITDPWLAKAKDSAVFVLLRPARLMRALIDVVPELAAKREQVLALADDPVVITGASDGTSLTIEGVLPAKILAALATFD